MILLVIAGMAGLRPDFIIYSLAILGFMFSGIAVHYVRALHRQKLKSYRSIDLTDTTETIFKRVK